MKFAKAALVIYCSLILAVATFDTLADPERQPVKNLIAIIIAGLTITGVLKKKQKLLLALPIQSGISLIVTAANTSNVAVIVGQAVGSLVPLLLVYAVYKGNSRRDVLNST